MKCAIIIDGRIKGLFRTFRGKDDGASVRDDCMIVFNQGIEVSPGDFDVDRDASAKRQLDLFPGCERRCAKQGGNHALIAYPSRGKDDVPPRRRLDGPKVLD